MQRQSVCRLEKDVSTVPVKVVSIPLGRGYSAFAKHDGSWSTTAQTLAALPASDTRSRSLSLKKSPKKREPAASRKRSSSASVNANAVGF